VKFALALAASAVLSIGAMGGFVAWRHAHPGTYERELAWIESYVQWRSEIDDALDNGDTETVLRCERRLLELTGSASTATLAELQLAALGGCRSLRSEIYAAGGDELEDRVYDDWYATRYTMIGGLSDERERTAQPTRSPLLAKHVAPYAGTMPVVLGAGRPPSYEELMAGLAWDVEYPAMIAEYQIDTCHDGGPLDLRPRSDVWP
jgi:hypothetical protein